MIPSHTISFCWLIPLGPIELSKFELRTVWGWSLVKAILLDSTVSNGSRLVGKFPSAERLTISHIKTYRRCLMRDKLSLIIETQIRKNSNLVARVWWTFLDENQKLKFRNSNSGSLWFGQANSLLNVQVLLSKEQNSMFLCDQTTSLVAQGLKASSGSSFLARRKMHHQRDSAS